MVSRLTLRSVEMVDVSSYFVEHLLDAVRRAGHERVTELDHLHLLAQRGGEADLQGVVISYT
jgi:hypothetical protein